MSARKLLSIDVLEEVSICGSSQKSVDGDVLFSIDAVCHSLRIVRSRSAGSDNSTDFFLFLLVPLGMHLKRSRKKIMRKLK